MPLRKVCRRPGTDYRLRGRTLGHVDQHAMAMDSTLAAFPNDPDLKACQPRS